MRAGRMTTAMFGLAAVLALGACGDPGSGGGVAAPTTTAGATGVACAPVAGDQLVALKDDLGLQNADNVIPAVNATVATANPAILTLLDSVSAVLDTPALVALNKAVDVDRRTSTEVAAAFVEEHGLVAKDTPGTGVSLVVGAANFSENATLAEVYAAVLRSAGYDATTRTIGSRETYLPALASGEVAVVPEYAARLVTFLNSTLNGADAPAVASPDVDATVTALTPLATQYGLTMGMASAAQDQNGFAVTTAFADQHSVTTLSELAAACAGGVVLAGPPECPERPFCQLGLEETYGLVVSEFQSYDFGAIGDAVRQGRATVGLVLTSDGSLATASS